MKNKIVVKSIEFLSAIEKFMPKNMRINIKKKKYLFSQEICFSQKNNNLAISSEIIKATCPIISGDWNGYVYLTLHVLYAFYKVPPLKEELTIIFAENKIKIESSIVPARLCASPNPKLDENL